MSRENAEKFAQALNLKFAGTSQDHYTFAVEPGGQKYLKISQTPHQGYGKSVHAFVDAETGAVYKSAGWKAPFKDKTGKPVVRYANIWDAVAAADPFGGYLYER